MAKSIISLVANNDPLTGQSRAFPFEPAELRHRTIRLKQSSILTRRPGFWLHSGSLIANPRLFAWGIFILAVFGSGCAKTPLLKTTTVIFRCDSAFNEGLRLPVDLVYVPEGENIKTVTSVAPDSWFDSEAREQWQFKQSLSLVESGERRDITVQLDRPSRTVALVVYVDYKDNHTAKGQVVVFDAAAKETENVFVTSLGILHQSP